MANIKITDLAAYTDPASTDVLPIVDVGADVTKKVSIADLLENAGSGTAAAPGIAFDGDSDTGIYSPGADQVAISTNGTGRLFVAANGNVGIDDSSPQVNSKLAVSNGGAETFEFQTGVTSGKNTLLSFNRSTSTWVEQNYAASAHTFNINSSSSNEVARIDGSGRLLVGTSSGRTVGTVGTASVLSQIESTGGDAGLSIIRNSNGTTAGSIILAKSRGTANGSSTVVQADDDLGYIHFNGADGSDVTSVAARISAQVDGTPGANDMPGRLVFSVTADGASSPTERMRITNDGEVQFGDSTTRNRAITSETDYYSTGRNRLQNSWFVLRKGYKATGTSVAAEATITLSASAGSPEAFHKIRAIQSGALTRAYYEFLVSEASGTFSVVQDLADYNKAQFTVSMSSPTLTITSGTAAVDFVFLQVEIETFAMGDAEPTVSFATV